MIVLDGISCLRIGRNGAYRAGSLALLILLIGGCGAHANRELVSITVTPSAADAQNFPSGQVQFVATGIYSQPPTPVQLSTPDISWCIGGPNGRCDGFIRPGATIDGNGLASCVSGYSGVVTVLAGQLDTKTPVIPDTGTPLNPFGSAQLTCP